VSTKLSIIVPIYNSENYLKDCLNSICKQIKKNIELILVDDCSKDRSNKICNTYINKFNFIKLVTLKKNHGVSYARNVGIKLSIGKFICFVDSDDKLLPGSINNILNNIKIFNKEKLFVIRNYVLKNKHTKKTSNLIPNEKKKSIINSTNCWNFIVKKNFLTSNNIYFKKMKVTEDWVFVSEMLCLTNSFKIIEKPVYMHRMYEPNTLGKKTGYLIVIDRIKVIYEIGKIICKKKIFLNNEKTKLLKKLLELSAEQMYSNILLCKPKEIKNTAKYLKRFHLIMLKLSSFGFKKFDYLLKSSKSIYAILSKFKSKNIKILNNLFENNNKNNLILFCVGGYGKTALQILLNINAKVDFILDNNPIYSGKKIDNLTIKNPAFLKKNLIKFLNHKIFISNKKNSEFKKIKLQLKKIGVKNKNIFHFNL
jgi:glycosyltransferase involved in cell wall biosynthesis